MFWDFGWPYLQYFMIHILQFLSERKKNFSSFIRDTDFLIHLPCERLEGSVYQTFVEQPEAM